MADPKLGHPDKINLPVRTFMYTLDQLCAVMDIPNDSLGRLLYYQGRSFGPPGRSQIRVVNIAAEDTDKPEWRCAEREFIRYLKVKGFKFNTRGMF